MASPQDDFGGDSLFEGMVLFSPSDLSPPPPTPPLPPQEPPPPPLETPSPPTAPATAKCQPHSQPLDEDLFSDLTLQSLDSQPQNLEPDPIPAISRQISRKKKRAVRVGYARAPIEESYPRSTPINGKAFPDHQFSSEQSGEPKDEILAHVIEDRVNKSEDDEHQQQQQQEEEEEKPQKEEPLDSIEDKLEIVRVRIGSKLGKIRETAGVLCKQRKELGRRRRKAMENVNLVSEKYKELERELEEACEAEDFERAERVSESLAEKDREKGALMSELRDVELECDAVDLQMQNVLESRIAAEEEGAVLMEQFAKVWRWRFDL